MVIVEGIVYTHICGAMLTRLLVDHRWRSPCYRYQLPFEETARRQASKPQATE